MMRNSIIFLLVTMLFLAGCQNSSSEDENLTSSGVHQANKENSNDANVNSETYVTTTTNENGQVFRVISSYKRVNQYVQKAKDVDSERERSELWQEIVIDHIQAQCLGEEYSGFVHDFVYKPPKDLDDLKADIRLLSSSNPEETAIESLKASAKKFPGPDTTVCLLPRHNEVNASGLSPDAEKILVFYIPTRGKTFLKRTIAHEYHHSTLAAKYPNNRQRNLLGYIISQGKAEYFASLVFEQSEAVFNNMNAEQERRLWQKVKESLHSTNSFKINDVIFGGKNGLPYNYGYFLGYQIVSEYVKMHPEVTVEEWSKLSPKELYEKSGYEDSL